jgi:general secretion pathway protein G
VGPVTRRRWRRVGRGRAGGTLGGSLGSAGFTLVEMLVVSVVMGTLAALAVPRTHEVLHRAQVARAASDIRAIEIDLFDFWSDQERLPTSLTEIGRAGLQDPWGNTYVYTRIAGATGGLGGLRKDRFLVPLNSDFDLYSRGRDGQSSPPLTAAASKDDVIRANDGGYVGLAEEY